MDTPDCCRGKDEPFATFVRRLAHDALKDPLAPSRIDVVEKPYLYAQILNPVGSATLPAPAGPPAFIDGRDIAVATTLYRAFVDNGLRANCQAVRDYAVRRARDLTHQKRLLSIQDNRYFNPRWRQFATGAFDQYYFIPGPLWMRVAASLFYLCESEMGLQGRSCRDSSTAELFSAFSPLPFVANSIALIDTHTTRDALTLTVYPKGSLCIGVANALNDVRLTGDFDQSQPTSFECLLAIVYALRTVCVDAQAYRVYCDNAGGDDSGYPMGNQRVDNGRGPSGWTSGSNGLVVGIDNLSAFSIIVARTLSRRYQERLRMGRLDFLGVDNASRHACQQNDRQHRYDVDGYDAALQVNLDAWLNSLSDAQRQPILSFAFRSAADAEQFVADFLVGAVGEIVLYLQRVTRFRPGEEHDSLHGWLALFDKLRVHDDDWRAALREEMAVDCCLLHCAVVRAATAAPAAAAANRLLALAASVNDPQKRRACQAFTGIFLDIATRRPIDNNISQLDSVDVDLLTRYFLYGVAFKTGRRRLNIDPLTLLAFVYRGWRVDDSVATQHLRLLAVARDNEKYMNFTASNAYRLMGVAVFKWLRKRVFGALHASYVTLLADITNNRARPPQLADIFRNRFAATPADAFAPVPTTVYGVASGAPYYNDTAWEHAIDGWHKAYEYRVTEPQPVFIADQRRPIVKNPTIDRLLLHNLSSGLLRKH